MSDFATVAKDILENHHLIVTDNLGERAITALVAANEADKREELLAEYQMLWEFWVDPLNDDVELEQLFQDKLATLNTPEVKE
jgi:hypothetical protein